MDREAFGVVRAIRIARDDAAERGFGAREALALAQHDERQLGAAAHVVADVAEINARAFRTWTNSHVFGVARRKVAHGDDARVGARKIGGEEAAGVAAIVVVVERAGKGARGGKTRGFVDQRGIEFTGELRGAPAGTEVGEGSGRGERERGGDDERAHGFPRLFR